LASAARINLDIRRTSFFRFVLRITCELIPRRICDAFRHRVVPDHPGDAQVLKYDYAETVDQLPAFLMSKVLASIAHTLVNTSNNLAALCSFGRSLWLFAQAALRSFQIFLIAAKEARVINRLARTQRITG